jgi:DNA-binding NarL/FixJ family response regulator
MQRPRLLLVDDNPHVLKLVADLLKEEFEIVATARDGTEALAAAVRLQPDAVVSDLSMPGMSGLELGARWRAVSQRACVVILTIHQDRHLAQIAFGNGVLGYVLKHRLHRDLVPALRSALRGERFASPSLRIT